MQRRFRRSGSDRDPVTHRLAPLLDPSRIVLGLRCDEREDAFEIGAARRSTMGDVPDAAQLAELFRARTDEVEPGLGEGIALVAAGSRSR